MDDKLNTPFSPPPLPNKALGFAVSFFSGKKTTTIDGMWQVFTSAILLHGMIYVKYLFLQLMVLCNKHGQLWIQLCQVENETEFAAQEPNMD